MKKIGLVSMLCLFSASAAFSQLRLDAGFSVPRALGALSSQYDSEDMDDANEMISGMFLPIPDMALHYQFGRDGIKLGLGVRAFTAIYLSYLWPNVFAEIDLGPFVAEAQFGGGAYAFYYLQQAYGIAPEMTFLPDLSLWWTFGRRKNFRLGAGFIGYMTLGQSTGILPLFEEEGSAVFAFYIGGKVSLLL